MASKPFRWRGSLGQYIKEELRVLTFPSDEELRKAIHLWWHDSEFIGMPHDYRDDLAIGVPQEAVELFQERDFTFQVSAYLTRGDYNYTKLIDRKGKDVGIDDFVSHYWVDKPKRITFFEKDAVLCFGYEERVLDLKTEGRERWKIYKIEQQIPQHIVEQGEDAIKIHVEREITTYLEDAREREAKQEAYAANLNHPLVFRHNGVVLKGMIVSGLDSTLVVRLEDPYQGERSVHFGFGSAMAGRYIFDREGKLSPAAFEAARRWMVYIFEEQDREYLNKDVIDLARRLNSSGDDNKEEL